MNFVQSLYGCQWRGWVALVAAVIALFFMLVLFPRASAKTGSDKNNVVDLQKTYTPEMFTGVLRGWSTPKTKEDEREENKETLRNAVGIMKRENIIKLDIIFPFVYALALAFAYAWARGEQTPTRLDAALFLYPFIAGLFDLIENGLHLYLLRGVETMADVAGANFSPVLIGAAAFFAYSKFLLLATSLGVIIAALITSRGLLTTVAVAGGVAAVGTLFDRLKNAF